MYTIHIYVHCPHQNNEMIPHNLELAEFVVESHVSLALLELFGEIIIENVSIAYTPTEQEETQ
jgi:hypothetical protein